MPRDLVDRTDDPDESGHWRPPAEDPRASGGEPVPPAGGAPERKDFFRAHLAAVRRAYAADEGTAAASAGDGGSWSEVLPSLRAAWDEHEKRYPERKRATPETHIDGSWSCGASRKLSPDQNAEVTKACADIHNEGHRVMLPAMRQVEDGDPDRRLAGLEHMLKGVDRLKEKIAERLRLHPNLAPRQAVAEVPDAVRFTLTYSETRYTSGVLADVDRLKNAGYELVKLKNLWAKDQYKGINSQWLRPETRLRFEVQFHTPNSREAKELTHKAYERLRDPHTSTSEERALEDYQRRVNALINPPPDVFKIEDYPPEKRDA